MIFFELEPTDISSLDDGDLRELVARLCEAELIQQGIQPSSVKWGGAQEAPDGGLDVSVKSASKLADPNFVPRENTGFQVKKHSMSKSACRKEMEEYGKTKPVIENLASRMGAYIIVSGRDDCSEKMLSDRIDGMKQAIDALQSKADLLLDFYGRDRLSNWLRSHPSVALWVRSRLGKPLAGWKPYGRWAATPPDQSDELLVDEHPCVIDENSGSKEAMPAAPGIQLTRDRLREFGSTVRITGLSGVGKTRFAQALFEAKVGFDALPPSEVIYADLGNDLTPTASELTAYLIANDFATYLVLDNCPPDVHRSLQKQVAESSAKLRLLTIEYDISEDKPEETEVIHLEPTSEKTVSALTQRRFPELGPVNADRIAEFAGGNARIALALAGRVNADETLSNFSDEDLFQRLFSQRKGASPELLRSAEILALVYSFNVSRTEFGDELCVLGTIASLARQALHRDQAELLRRQLAQQRGSWRAILPHALANRLAKRALQNIPLEDINAELFKQENLRLFQSCAHRLGYLHDFGLARELAQTWIRYGAPLGNIAGCSDEHLAVLDYVAPIFPEVVLNAIEQASTVPDFASRKNKNFIRFVRLLCHIAYEDETFDRAAAVLLKFAETENMGENNNSIVGYLRQLFSLHLSGTVALPERRQAFVKRLLNSDTSRHREIAAELLRSAFESRRWTSLGTFHFGARKRDLGWEPKTQDERISWYVGYIQLLQPLLTSTQIKDQDWAKSMLARHFRSLWSFAGCFDLVEKIIQQHEEDGSWPEMWTSIKRTLHFDGEKHDPELLVRLEVLEKLTAPSDLYSEIEAYALAQTWDHIEFSDDNYQDRVEKISEMVITLGARAASEMQILDRLGAKLWSTQAQPILWFGRGLALGAEKRLTILGFLVDSLQRHQFELTNIRLLEGFINGVHDSNPGQVRQILEHLLEIPELKLYAVDLLIAAPITPWAVGRLQEIAQGRDLEAFRFEQLMYGRIHEAMQDNELASLLAKINALDKGYLSTIQILSMRGFGKAPHEYSPSDELCAVARGTIFKLVSAHRDERSQSPLHGIDRVLDHAFNTTASESDVNAIIKALCDGIATYRLYTFELTEVIAVLIRKYPELILDAVFDGSENERALATLLFRERFSRDEPTLNDAPLDRVMAWCGNDQERIAKIARAVQAFCADDVTDEAEGSSKEIILSEQIKSLLNVAIDKSALVEIIFDDIFPGAWSGSLANILESRLKPFVSLLEYPSPEVPAVVRSKIPLIEYRIHMEREREAAEHNEREQRFE